MTAATRLGKMLHDAYFGPAWHGPAVAELLADVTAARAAAPPIAGTHSIWQLVLHIAAWKEEVHRRLSGPGRKLTAEEDWPAIPDMSEAAWRGAVERLNSSQRALEDAVATLSDEQLTGRGGGADAGGDQVRGFEQLLHVIIHHDLYHAGQIAILKNAARR